MKVMLPHLHCLYYLFITKLRLSIPIKIQSAFSFWRRKVAYTTWAWSHCSSLEFCCMWGDGHPPFYFWFCGRHQHTLVWYPQKGTCFLVRSCLWSLWSSGHQESVTNYWLSSESNIIIVGFGYCYIVDLFICLFLGTFFAYFPITLERSEQIDL